MKFRNIFFVFLVLIIIALGVFGYFKAIPEAEDQGAKLPKIEISPKSHDFEEVDYGQILEYTFKIKNTGQGVLEIKRIATSCACTTAETEKESLAPAEETNLLVKYDTGAMSGPHGRGDQERIIYIKSSDPINPQVEVKITAYVN